MVSKSRREKVPLEKHGAHCELRRQRSALPAHPACAVAAADTEHLEAPAGAFLGLVFPFGLFLVLRHLTSCVLVRRVVMLVHVARVVLAIHGLALHAAIVLLLLQAATVILLLAVRVLRASVVEHQRTGVTVILGAFLVRLLEPSVAAAARVLLQEVGKAAGKSQHAEFQHHWRRSSSHPDWVL